MKAVPQFIPSAPIASAAASCLPLAHPPEACDARRGGTVPIVRERMAILIRKVNF
jgi:hypothetical protein